MDRLLISQKMMFSFAVLTIVSPCQSPDGMCQILCTVDVGMPSLTDVSFWVSPSALQLSTDRIFSAGIGGLPAFAVISSPSEN